MMSTGEVLFNEWWSYAALLLFVVVVISPAWAFSKVDRALDDADIATDASMTHPSSRISLIGMEEQMLRESHILKNMERMISHAPTEQMRGIWLRKREQYIKEIRWRKLVEVCDGKSRVHA